MLRTLTQQVFRRMFQRNESGQSIVILALGFMGLLAFVGLTTDFSLLYVRYSTLRRAVDSAAIAAAGQVRQDRTLGEVGLAARQFIQFHNLNPREVLIDTCANSPDMDTTTPGIIVDYSDPANPIDDRDPELCTTDLRKIVRVTAVVDSPTVFLRLFGFENFELRASSLSETAVLDVVLVMDVSESMLNETTVADWAQVNQAVAYVPPSTAFGNPGPANANPETIFERLMRAGGPYATELLYGVDDVELYYEAFWQRDLLGAYTPLPQEEVNKRLSYYDRADHPETTTLLRPADLPGADAEDSNAYIAWAFVPSRDNTGRDRDEQAIPAVQNHPRDACRVRFWPYGVAISLSGYQRDLYADHGVDDYSGGRWSGFVPAYNFYGCCNDPSTGATIDRREEFLADGIIRPPATGVFDTVPDFRFDDLVCEPMKSARDATRQFLDRLDFLRGDRVGFVTFDRGAFLIDPDGVNGLDRDGNGTVEPEENSYHMIEDRETARDALDWHVGVRAEPNFYLWDGAQGGWTGFSQGIDENGYSIPIDYYRTVLDRMDFPARTDGTAPSEPVRDLTIASNYNDYPVKDNCPFFNAALAYPFSRYGTRNASWDALAEGDRPYYANGPSLYNVMTPDIVNDPFPWSAYDLGGVDAVLTPDLTHLNSYELWSSCRGTNIGAGLRTAYNALTNANDPRRDPTGSDLGVVQIVIVLSDGAAGASDPTRRDGELPQPALPYALVTDSYTPADPYAVPPVPSTGERGYGARGTYGAYGLCPYGTPDRPGELIDTANEPSIIFPFCSDELPQTRHFCYPPAEYNINNLPPVNISGFQPSRRDTGDRLYDVDVGQYPNVAGNCDLYYDVDDYARDWADFVTCAAGSQYEGAPQCGDVIPTIFTIGFGLQFPLGDRSCEENVPDCLGEELLRYIADVGDDFIVDTDYQQDWLDDGELNNSLTEEDYGSPAVCEPPGGGYIPRPENPVAADIELLNEGVSCGNYFNAPSGRELDIVFDEIAARMFTRLSR